MLYATRNHKHFVSNTYKRNQNRNRQTHEKWYTNQKRLKHKLRNNLFSNDRF